MPAVLLLALTALLLLHFRAAGPEMDEGEALAYPLRILHGDLPYRDFETFYGPGNPFLVAGAFLIGGVGLSTERLVGLLYRLLLAVGVLATARRFGLPSALSAGLLLLFLLPGTGVWAWAGYGAVGAGAAALALLSEAQLRPTGRVRERLFTAAGAAAGATVLMRFDYAPAALVSAVPVLLGAGRKARLRWSVGFVVTALLYVPLLVAAGPAKVGRVAGDIRASAAGRHLPLPPLEFFPANVLSAVVVSAVALTIGGGALALRGADARPRVLVGAGLFSLATLPHTLSRADTDHVVLAALLPVPLLPALLAVAARRLDARIAGRNARALVTGATAVVAVLFAGYVLGARSKTELSPLIALGKVHSTPIRHEGREFRVRDPDDALAAQLAVDAAARLSGRARTLFVGPGDLRRPNYADTYFYYLLDEYEPAGFHLELNPGANRTGRLAHELARADVLLLDHRYDTAFERNASSEYGSAAPNRYVRSHFCAAAREGGYVVLVRCGLTGAAAADGP